MINTGLTTFQKLMLGITGMVLACGLLTVFTEWYARRVQNTWLAAQPTPPRPTLPATWTPPATGSAGHLFPTATAIMTTTAVAPLTPAATTLSAIPPTQIAPTAVITSAFAAPLLPETVVSNLIPLPYLVVDSAYSVPLQRLVLAADRPPYLHLLDPETGEDTIISLSSAATSVDLSLDGWTAAIGQQNRVTLIDLEKAHIDQQIEITGTVQQVVMTETEWLYVFFADAEVADTQRVNLTTGVIEEGFGFPWGQPVFASFYPGKPWLMTTASAVEPIWISMANISDTEPAYQVMLMTNGGACGHFWLFANYQQLLTACGSVYAMPSLDDTYTEIYDLEYVHWFDGITYVVDMVEAPAINRILLLPGTLQSYQPAQPGQTVAIFETDTFNPVGLVTLPKVQIGGQAWDTWGKRIFVNPAGMPFYVLVQWQDEEGLPRGFGIYRGEQ